MRLSVPQLKYINSNSYFKMDKQRKEKKEFRKLIYQEKALEEFGVKDENSRNHIIYYSWLRKRTEIDPFGANCKEYYLKAFNDAYYICTLALMLPLGLDLNPSNLLKYIENPSIVFPMVHLYLSKIGSISNGIRHFLDVIETKFKIQPDWEQSFEELQAMVSECEYRIDPSIFAQRKLTKEVLSCFEWYKLTGSFKKEKIEYVVKNFARTSDDWHLMCEAIKESAQIIDFENRDDYYVDDEGRTCKDHTFESKGVYQFCDELSERYNELALLSQPMDIDLSIEPITTDYGLNNRNKCFKHNSPFVQELVKKAHKSCCKSKASYVLLEVTLYDHGQLSDRNSHLAFLRKLVEWKILPGITETELNKIAFSMRDKARRLPKEGYRSWDNRPKDKLKCEEIGKILGDDMPYNR